MSEQAIEVFRALSDDVRAAIVSQLIKNGEMSCQEVSRSIKLSQPAISHHFKKLEDAGIVLTRKEGVYHYHAVNQKLLARLGLNLNKALHVNS